jgi:hypothetical protein
MFCVDESPCPVLSAIVFQMSQLAIAFKSVATQIYASALEQLIIACQQIPFIYSQSL